ncbi:MAG: NCS2 family permease [Bacteroidales bacterium]|nr:NCS2 family permease [Candidatus Cacconaster merdequi]
MTTKSFLTKAFGFDPAIHNVRTEIVAGVTTFLTMAYILAVNPSIFSVLPGMPAESVFTATALAAIIATTIMAFYSKRPFGLAPGMGTNACFVYTVCMTMGYSWQFALTAVLIEGTVMAVLTLTKVRTRIADAFPVSIKNAIGSGIGLFIAFVGLQNAGIVVDSENTLVALGDITHGTGLLAMIGLVISCSLVMLHVRGGLLIGILATTIIGLFIKDPATGMALTRFNGIVSAPPSVAPIAFKFDFSHIFSADMLTVVLTFLFIDIFAAMGSVIGVSQKAGFIKNDGSIDRIDRIFLADSIGTISSSLLGTSSTTTYVESSAGVGAGGRTGLTAFSTAVCFALALLFGPLFLAIPGAATAPALIIVGMMMLEPVAKIKWLNYRESIPAFLTLILMPMAYSISDGILIGMIAYVLLFALSGKHKEISPAMWILAAVFILKYIFM